MPEHGHQENRARRLARGLEGREEETLDWLAARAATLNCLPGALAHPSWFLVRHHGVVTISVSRGAPRAGLLLLFPVQIHVDLEKECCGTAPNWCRPGTPLRSILQPCYLLTFTFTSTCFKPSPTGPHSLAAFEAVPGTATLVQTPPSTLSTARRQPSPSPPLRNAGPGPEMVSWDQTPTSSQTLPPPLPNTRQSPPPVKVR